MKSLRRLLNPPIVALLRAAEGEWVGMLLTGLGTGQRLNDVARLRWGALDLGKRRIDVGLARSNSRVEVPLSRVLRGYLMNLPDVATPDAPLFPGAFKQPLRSLRLQFQQIAAKAGLTRWTFDCLRLCYCIHPLPHLDPSVVAALLGRQSDRISHYSQTPGAQRIKRRVRRLPKRNQR